MKMAQGIGRTEGIELGCLLAGQPGSDPAAFQVMPPLPSPGGELAAEMPLWLCFKRILRFQFPL